MSFSPVKSGGWAFGEILTSTQMNNLDADHAEAVDGAAGGSYTLSATLGFTKSTSGTTFTIAHTGGGSSVALAVSSTGPSAALTVTGGATIDDATFTGAVFVTDDFNVNDNFVVTASNGNTDIDGTIDVAGAAALHGAVTCSSTVALQSTTTNTGEFILSSAGKIRYRVTEGTDSDSSYGIDTTDVLIANTAAAGGPSANRNYTILNTGAQIGHVIHFINLSAFTVTLKREDTTTIDTVATGERAMLVRYDLSGVTWVSMGNY